MAFGGLCLFSFFFSSRRRHTRLVSDWSSDVCSSDLPDAATGKRAPETAALAGGLGHRSCAALRPQDRSEERRVGKEGRSRWAPGQQKKNEKREGRMMSRNELYWKDRGEVHL